MSKDNNNLTILSGQSVLLPSQNEIQAIKMGVRRPPFAFTEQGVSQF